MYCIRHEKGKVSPNLALTRGFARSGSAKRYVLVLHRHDAKSLDRNARGSIPTVETLHMHAASTTISGASSREAPRPALGIPETPVGCLSGSTRSGPATPTHRSVRAHSARHPGYLSTRVSDRRQVHDRSPLQHSSTPARRWSVSWCRYFPEVTNFSFYSFLRQHVLRVQKD